MDAAGSASRRRRRPRRRQAEEKPAEPAEKKAPPRKRTSSRTDSRRKQPTRRAPLPAAKRELLVSVDVTEQAVAVLEDDRVAEVYLERPGRRSIAGNIYKGVVDNVLPGMEAAFVEIGLEKNGFLYVDEIVGPELEGKRHGRRIQDLLARGQEILVQAVKDPMKSKGARLTTEISLPGRFVVYVPQGEGIGVSRRLEDDERTRLKEILRAIKLPKGGLIVRTAAEGASPEDIERDVRFLEKLWKEIQASAKKAPTPSLVYSEAELPLRVVRDLFTEDFERALVDDDLTLRRITGYLKKTSPHMAERVVRYKERTPLFEAHGVDTEIRSTLHKRVDLPSGGYLIFDYAEAFTVIDVNTGRFVGSRSRTSTARLEETVTKNNVEAAKEVVRQLRLRDIGGIIVIDFVDMANPKNRATVEEALKRELERDRTKTYVVEISPLGLVEMTRQNVTEGPREILTRRCPTCEGDGTILSEASAAVDTERRLRALASESPRTKAFRVELNARVRDLLVGPGAMQLQALEDVTKRRFFLESKRRRSARPLQRARQGAAREASAPGRRRGGRRARAQARRGRAPRHRVGGRQAQRVGHRRRGRGEARRQEGEDSRRARARRDGVRDARGRRRAGCRTDHGRGSRREADAGVPLAEGRRGARGADDGRSGGGGGRGGRRGAVAEETAKESAEEPAPPRRRRRSGRAAARGAGATARRSPLPPLPLPRLRTARSPRRPRRRRSTCPPPTSAPSRRPTATRRRRAEAPKKKRTRRGSRGGRRRRKPAAAGVSAEAAESAAPADAGAG